MVCLRMPPLSVIPYTRIASFCDFHVFIFEVCDIATHPLPIPKFLRDETFADGY